MVLTLIVVGYFYFIRRDASLKYVRNFAIYYGNISNEILQDMSRYDMVIVEGLQFDRYQVEEVKKKKTLIIGYLSVMEIGSWDKELTGKLGQGDYLTINGVKQYSAGYGNFIGDISNRHFRESLIDILETRIVARGMDGVFLDTTGWLDDYKSNRELYLRLLKGYEELLKEIRARHHGLLILQNRGFSNFFDMSSDYIDGIVWENFDSVKADTDDTVRERAGRVRKTGRKKDVTVFMVSYTNEKANSEYAQRMKWKHLQHNDGTVHNQWLFEK